MIDSGSFTSLKIIQESIAVAYAKQAGAPHKEFQLVSAIGKGVPVLGIITLPLCLDKLKVARKPLLTQTRRLTLKPLRQVPAYFYYSVDKAGAHWLQAGVHLVS